jgi:pyrimidine-nucleoside phosphorylase
MLLGAGRATTDDPIDFGAGLLLAVRAGDALNAGDLLCTMWSARDELLDSAEERFLASVSFSPEPTQPPPLFHEL